MIKTLEEQVKALPPELKQEVANFVASLIEKQVKRAREQPTFGWTGALKDLRHQYTSVELQHRISGWRIGCE